MPTKQVLIVFGHEDSMFSFNAAMKDAAVEILQRHDMKVKCSCLYDMKFASFSRDDIEAELNHKGFNWGLESGLAYEKGILCEKIKEEQKKVVWADTIIFQFPIHNLMMPGIISNWMSRILVKNFSFSDTACFEAGFMKGKKILLSVTFAGFEEMLTDKGVFGDINIILWPMIRGLMFHGFSVLKPNISYGIFQGNTQACDSSIEQWKQRLETLHKEDVLTNFVPFANFESNGDMKKEAQKKFEKDIVGPSVGQHMGKVLPKIV